jgi:hypothetical protein
MLLTAIWNILSKLEPYSDKGYLVDRNPQAGRVLTAAQALKLLKSRGYVIKDEPEELSTA